MSSNDFNVHFVVHSQSYDIDFQEEKEASSGTVLIDGRNYSLHGDTVQIFFLMQETIGLSPDQSITIENLQSRLKEIEATELSITEKVRDFSQARLFPSERIDVSSANEAYLQATEKPEEAHMSVGILRPNPKDKTSQTISFSLGKDEDYGAHRVGSVTKTFTTFLALKLVKDGVIRLDTTCGEIIKDEKILKRVFAEPEKAKKMTLEQLLSHTSGLELEDWPQGGVQGNDSRVKFQTLHERFVYQGTMDYRYKHEHSPGSGKALYSNIGFDVAAWMMEIAYNHIEPHEIPQIPFSQIMRDELFTEVFGLSKETRISPGPSGSGDVIQAGCGDMVTTVQDLLQVAQTLQKGEENLSGYFGKGWHKTMLTQRATDGEVKVSGLGCEPNASSIQFSGLNCEVFEGGEERDVTAHIAFPLQKNQPGLVAMCDSNALGPLENQVRFRNELRKLAGLSIT